MHYICNDDKREKHHTIIFVITISSFCSKSQRNRERSLIAHKLIRKLLLRSYRRRHCKSHKHKTSNYIPTQKIQKQKGRKILLENST